MRSTTLTDITYTSLYGGARPNFSFHPDHQQDPSITATVETWGRILKEFYESHWHTAIKADPKFLAGRQARSSGSI